MTIKKHIGYTLIIGFLMTFSSLLMAEQVVIQGDHELHYNTFPSTFLSKEIANTYQITRSKNRGILSISVMDKSGEEPKAVEADITIEAKNLVHQSKDIKLIKIVEQDEAIYYLGTFALNNEENVNFSIEAKPTGSNTLFQVKFSREFFTD
ncbi:DUF4426 domain-containing protein [Marinicella gelatinilytica]|uniref:DUF4426 domain-containing protein n=1 Tax=Marinicella gelatinilytica TaxID=2996017 RepID=UPI002260F3F4|nr:DUF4426 domain-containing protein [Marinicella gelatinilytica]MCX7544682.1 DUF4426 domain-containing protein [Marinicella gelatinilytica]